MGLLLQHKHQVSRQSVNTLITLCFQNVLLARLGALADHQMEAFTVLIQDATPIHTASDPVSMQPFSCVSAEQWQVPKVEFRLQMEP